MVSVRRDWWDNKVFEAYPTWEDAVEDRCNYFGQQADNFISLVCLERYFGKQNENGPAHYSQSVTYGIGREVLAKMLPGETKFRLDGIIQNWVMV